VLFVTGICTVIIFFPTNPIFAVLLFALIKGSGIFIGYKQKKTRRVLLAALWIVSWGYAAVSLFMFEDVDNEFWYRFLFPLFFLSGLVTLPIAWFGRWRTPQYSSLRNAFLTYVIYVIIVVPFVFAFAWDYNIRGDASPPEVLDLKIVAKYVAIHDELPDELTLQVETLDGRSVFFLEPSERFYDAHEEGALIRATVHNGALGGMWVEGYR
jgi:hypothetical protein